MACGAISVSRSGGKCQCGEPENHQDKHKCGCGCGETWGQNIVADLSGYPVQTMLVALISAMDSNLTMLTAVDLARAAMHIHGITEDKFDLFSALDAIRYLGKCLNYEFDDQVNV